jgi:hypothetical protein
MRRAILSLLLFLSPALTLAQSTTVSGQVTDLGGQSWNNGFVTATFVPTLGWPGPYAWTGGTFGLTQQTVKGSLSGTGSYSISIPSNTALTPINSQWLITVYSATIPQFTSSQTITITGATQTVNFTPLAILTGAAPGIVVYATGEISGANIGSQVYVIGTGMETCSTVVASSCTVWVAPSGTGTVTNVSVTANQGSVVNPTTTPVITISKGNGIAVAFSATPVFAYPANALDADFTFPLTGNVTSFTLTGGAVQNQACLYITMGSGGPFTIGGVPANVIGFPASLIPGTGNVTSACFENLDGTNWTNPDLTPATTAVGTVLTGQTNVYGAFLQNFAAATLKIPQSAGFTASVNSTIGLDTTVGITHHLTNGADSLSANTTSTSTTTTFPLFATAVAGVYNPRAIAAGDIPVGTVLWSSLGAPTGNLSLTMAGNLSTFNTTTALAAFFGWKNTTAAVVGTSQGSPVPAICGRAFHGSADVEDCLTLSELPGNGNDAAIQLSIGHTGTSTGGIDTAVPGTVTSGTSNSPGTAGYLFLPQGTDNSGATKCATTTVCRQAPTAVTSYAETVPGAKPVNNNSAELYSNVNPSVGAFAKMPQIAITSGAAYTNATTTFSNVVGGAGQTLQFSVEASTNYILGCQILWQSSANTAGPKFQFTGPASPTAVQYAVVQAVTATSDGTAGATAFSTSLNASGISVVVTTNEPAELSLGLVNGANAGTVTLQAAAQGVGTLTIQPGSYCQLQ